MTNTTPCEDCGIVSDLLYAVHLHLQVRAVGLSGSSHLWPIGDEKTVCQACYDRLVGRLEEDCRHEP